jgi:hypothetical protein
MDSFGARRTQNLKIGNEPVNSSVGIKYMWINLLGKILNVNVVYDISIKRSLECVLDCYLI